MLIKFPPQAYPSASKRSDTKETIPMFSFILRKHASRDKRVPETMQYEDANDDDRIDMAEIDQKMLDGKFNDMKNKLKLPHRNSLQF